ncbi:unnamed protein product [Cochlearia groenlandica]
MDEPKVTNDVTSTSGESSRLSSKVLIAGDRKLLKVELRQGETTYVSWKKLTKEASKENGSSSSAAAAPDLPLIANPNLESRLVHSQPAEGEKVDQSNPNRFNAVIEKIERLYMGKDSSDGEELDGAPDDDEYDTEDSFIDDAELDEYFEVDNSAIKHDGFFVNRGKLERIEPSTTTTSNQQPKKRKRKEAAKPCGDAVDVSRKQTKMAKTAGGKVAPSLANNFLTPFQRFIQSVIYMNVKVQDQPVASGPSPKKKSNDSKTEQDSVFHLKVQSGSDSLLLENAKHTDKGNHQPRNATSPKSKAVVSSGGLHMKCINKSANQHSNPLPGKSQPKVLEKSTVVHHKEKNGMHDLDNATISRQITQAKKGGSNVKPRTSTLEKAIRELEKVVVESRPSAATENQDADASSQAVKRRLPRDIKLKLAKVARIAMASQGMVSGELINRLMSIVGHLIQVRSLKRNLKAMIDSGDTAKREKDARFQRIKDEVIEMLKTQVPLMESQANNQEAGTSDDFQDDGSEKPPMKMKFVMDAALDDKICDLYDIFVDGMDEDSGSQIRKLYASLADLWPNKLMDNHEIKRAICRAKERRRASKGNLGKEMDQAKMTKRKQTQLAPKPETTTNPDKASAVGDNTVIALSATTASLVHRQPTAESSRDKSKQQHEKLTGISSSRDPSAETKTVRKKTEPSLEGSNLSLRQHTHPQVRTQAPLDLNLPS